ncbi:DUF6123 family protein [Pseudalkalibacillus berkeleyi]|uniref:DUF6123 family protein n=1 Tax=Pseudalkalibacillus berkeleyi TaxID=1069813 RepID=UPI0022A88A83|nr:DUF6123 family protein [Pseudalkalibacillus berkeleyi]
MRQKSTGEFIQFLSSKGFHLTDDDIAFIYFGKQYTGACDELVNVAIETTLKIQVRFDGSYYIALLEALEQSGAQNSYEAKRFIQNKELVTNT